MFVGTNNYEAGQIGGGILSKELKGKGDVVVYTIPGQTNMEERLEGYKRAVGQGGGIKFSRLIDIKGEPSAAFDATQSIVRRAGNCRTRSCAWRPWRARKWRTYCNAANVTGKPIIAMDASQSTLQWIQKGVIRATIAQKPYTMAYYGLQVLDDLHHNKAAGGMQNGHATLPVFIDTGTTQVDSSNVASFLSAAGPAR